MSSFSYLSNEEAASYAHAQAEVGVPPAKRAFALPLWGVARFCYFRRPFG